MDEHSNISGLGQPNVRITRARARALGATGGLPPLHPSAKHNNKEFRTNFKRAASDGKKQIVTSADPLQKKRAVLEDVTNTINVNCTNASSDQHSKQGTTNFAIKKVEVATTECHSKKPQVPRGTGGNIMGEMKGAKMAEPGFPEKLSVAEGVDVKESFSEHIPEQTLCIVRDEAPCDDLEENLNCRSIVDIDSKYMKDPQMCSSYAYDIYSNLWIIQLSGRPSMNYMETVQRDINQGMRSILVDWIVEVSDEYKMAPDTLYLTVNLVDRYLSENYIEKQRLQLLGITCMLIASKFEEICAPLVVELRSMTDNTYTKQEIVRMESRVLNVLGFRLSVPTTKKFLRRFIQVAQDSYQVPSVELEFLANYLAELTLIEYSFLKYLPSVVAASAVFIARWTLDQKNHPWNPVLEHYTRHKMSELKNAVLELQEVQLNTRGCPLKVIREKYKQSKFKCVSTLRSSRPVQLLF